MHVSLLIWGLTLVAIVAIIVADLLWADRRGSKGFSTRQAGFWSIVYIGLAMLFGLGVLAFAGGRYAAEFYAGFVTEKSLSADNLFVFYVIMARFAVPRQSQRRVLMLGVVIALVLRGVFIAIGAAAIARFQWVFFLFGAFLLWTAVGLIRDKDKEAHFEENVLVRWIRRVLPVTEGYHGSKISVRVGGRRVFTTLFIVMIAIGSADVLFALDSIPAIFGLTKEPYLVFTTNAFALMGLVQLYFLLGNLVQRLVYLSHGLAVILGFIGVKLVFEALHGYHVSWVPQIPIWLSLSVIGASLAVTAIVSLLHDRRSAASGPSSEEPGPATGG